MLESKSRLQEEGKDRTKVTYLCVAPVYRLQLFSKRHFIFLGGTLSQGVSVICKLSPDLLLCIRKQKTGLFM